MIIQNKDTVTLDFYKEEYKAKLINYQLTEDQRRYASVPLTAILKCEEDKTKYPIVILNNGEPVGFFVLHGWEGVKAYSDNEDAILIRGYSINNSFQGKGIAKNSLTILDSFVRKHFSNKNEIILAVNHENVVAQHVYKSAGFKDKGVRVMGRKGELYIFHKDVEV